MYILVCIGVYVCRVFYLYVKSSSWFNGNPYMTLDIFTHCKNPGLEKNVKLSEWESKETLITGSREIEEWVESRTGIDQDYFSGRSPLSLGYREGRQTLLKARTNNHIQMSFRF